MSESYDNYRKDKAIRQSLPCTFTPDEMCFIRESINNLSVLPDSIYRKINGLSTDRIDKDVKIVDDKVKKLIHENVIDTPICMNCYTPMVLRGYKEYGCLTCNGWSDFDPSNSQPDIVKTMTKTIAELRERLLDTRGYNENLKPNPCRVQNEDDCYRCEKTKKGLCPRNNE